MSVYIHSDSIASPLGIGSELNFNRVLNGDSGIKKHHNNSISSTPFFAAVVSDELLCQSPGSKINPKQWSNFTKLEKMLLLSIEDALSASTIRANDSKTILIFTTTKGNIDLLTNGLSGNVFLFKLAQKIGETLANPNPVLTVSNACISGLSGLIAASRLINSGRFDHAIVFGGDLVSEFTFSGFTSFKAISPEPCKPYDQARLGINLGEAAATLVLSKLPSPVSLLNGAVSNDANHISGPSRTGEGLQIAINQTLKYSGVSPNQIGFVSLHGTATSYNDEMECQALNAMQLESIPSHSLKGFFGHTLGAAGLVESALCVQMLKSGKTIPCHGFSEPGTTLPMNIETNSGLLKGDYILKTASGFGGCNAAILLAKSQPNPTDFHPI
ncbi:MAG: beta-ACP synthase, partial [Bacteroidia bacterium]|nr:beta-ACP synthase [Bacteroidia bacterium]